ncbi:MAG: sulfonate transport system substrate-binding protein, partial [Chloroflexota bacterium]|nr:sulfonate transport system substrate-binding protein [Chloroflexota bacterium]
MNRWNRLKHLAITATATIALVACGQAAGSASTSDDGPLTLRLGFFPNLTHATALVGVKKGFFTDALGPKVT